MEKIVRVILLLGVGFMSSHQVRCEPCHPFPLALPGVVDVLLNNGIYDSYCDNGTDFSNETESECDKKPIKNAQALGGGSLKRLNEEVEAASVTIRMSRDVYFQIHDAAWLVQDPVLNDGSSMLVSAKTPRNDSLLRATMGSPGYENATDFTLTLLTNIRLIDGPTLRIIFDIGCDLVTLQLRLQPNANSEFTNRVLETFKYTYLPLQYSQLESDTWTTLRFTMMGRVGSSVTINQEAIRDQNGLRIMKMPTQPEFIVKGWNWLPYYGRLIQSSYSYNRRYNYYRQSRVNKLTQPLQTAQITPSVRPRPGSGMMNVVLGVTITEEDVYPTIAEMKAVIYVSVITTNDSRPASVAITDCVGRDAKKKIFVWTIEAKVGSFPCFLVYVEGEETRLRSSGQMKLFHKSSGGEFRTLTFSANSRIKKGEILKTLIQVDEDGNWKDHGIEVVAMDTY